MSLFQRIFGSIFKVFNSHSNPLKEESSGISKILAKILPNLLQAKQDFSDDGLPEKQSTENSNISTDVDSEPELESSFSQVWAEHALIEYYLEQGEWEKAGIFCKKALSNLPDNPWLNHLQGKINLGKENYRAAVKSCQVAVSQDDTVSWFHYSLGEALLKDGRTDEAIPALQCSLELNPDFTWGHYYLGLALLKQGNFDDASKVFQVAKEHLPEAQEMLDDCLYYAQHLKIQDQRIQDYCKLRKAEAKRPERPLDILLITPYPTYPPKLGAITRMFQEAKELGKQHRLVVASIIFEMKGVSIVEEMEQYCELSLVTLIGDTAPESLDQPSLIRKYSSQYLYKMLTQLQSIDFDIVCFDFIYMAQYRDLFPNAYTVIGEHNIESELLKRFSALDSSQAEVEKLKQQTEAVEAFANAKNEATKLAIYEKEHWPKFDLRTVVSANDRTELLRRCPSEETWVVNNGIDTKTIPLLPNEKARKLFFFGTLTYFPNIDGAIYLTQEVMPHVWKEVPDMQLCIAGAEPPETVLALAEDPRIEVVASPDSMENVAKDCHISVVPLRVGSGTRIKILHSMAMGVPVVSTHLGCEGLEVVDGQHLLMRDQPEELAKALLELDRDRILWNHLRLNGRSLVEESYDWQMIYENFEARLYEAWRQQ